MQFLSIPYISLQQSAPNVDSVARVDALRCIYRDAASLMALEETVRAVNAMPIGRVEFLYWPGSMTTREVRGALLFSVDEHPVVYVQNALLGYDGAGPGLSRDIMVQLGMLPAAFIQLNQAAKLLRNQQQPFVAVIERVAGEWVHDLRTNCDLRL